MKRGRKLIYLGLALCLVASLLVFGCAEPAPAPAPSPAPAPAPAPAPKPTEPIKLKAITFLRVDEPTNDAWWPLIDTINERAKGELVIESLGGPEVITGFEQFAALKSGVVDMLHCTETWYASTVTGGVVYSPLSEFTPIEERENGYYDFRNEMLKPHNAFRLGCGSHAMGFNLYTNKKIEKPWDIAGQKIRVAPVYVEFVKALGATPTMMPPPEVYTAMERGVVDGFGWSAVGIIAFGWHEVTKYVIAPSFYQAKTEISINLDTWNKIPKHLQDIMIQAMIENEKEYGPHFAQLANDERQLMLDAGMEAIEFSPDDTKWYVDLAYSAGWDAVLKNIEPPELGLNLKELQTK